MARAYGPSSDLTVFFRDVDLQFAKPETGCASDQHRRASATQRLIILGLRNCDIGHQSGLVASRAITRLLNRRERSECRLSDNLIIVCIPAMYTRRRVPGSFSAVITWTI